MPLVLVADDDKDTLELMRSWLTKRNYDVLTASDGESAIRLAEAHLPDLILLDVMMPGLSGIEACKRLRSSEQTGHIPVILATAYDPAVGRVEALMAGATDYIIKPIQLDDLAERMRALLAHDVEFTDQSQRLLQETVHAALMVVPCNLAFLLTIDPRRRMLVGRAVAVSQGEAAARQFIRRVADGGEEFARPLKPDGQTLTQVALSGVAAFNLPLSALRASGERALYEACSQLDLYFVSILPLQVTSTPLGVLVLGSREPRDVETTRGQQLLASVASQAAMATNNARLMRFLAWREAESKREREFRQAVLDTMGDGLLVYNAQGRITFFNRRIALMTGHESESLHEARVEDLFSPMDRERVRQIVSAAQPMQTTFLEANVLRSDGSPLPVLIVQARHTIVRDEGEEERVMVLTDMGGLKAREQALAKQTQRLRALNRATQTIASTLSLDRTISTILTEASRVLDATAASVLLRAPDADELVFHAAVGPCSEKVRGLRVPCSQGIAGYVAREGRSLLVPDAYQSEFFYPEVDALTGMTTRAVAAVPLTVDDQVIGVVEVINKTSGTFDEADLEILESLTHSAAAAIRNAQLYDEARRRVRELTLLLRASEAASSTLSIENVLETVARQLIEALSGRWCAISAWDQRTNTLVHLAEVADLTWMTGDGPRVNLADCPSVCQVLETGQPVVTGHSGDRSPVEHLDPPSGEFAARLILPVAPDDHVAGLAVLHYLSGQSEFASDDVERCQNTLVAWRTTFGEADQWLEADHLHSLASRLLRATGASQCTLFEYDPANQAICAVHRSGKVVRPLGQGREIELDEANLRRVALVERTPVTVRLDPSSLSAADELVFLHMTGVQLITPLVAHGESIGLVELVDTNPQRVFTDDDLSLAQAIGNVVGNALDNARLYAALQRRAAQLEAAYNDLQQADRLKDEWIQNVSHELRTPLTSIIGYLDLLLEGDLGPLVGEQRESLEVINEKSRQLARLVDDILTVQEMEFEPPSRRSVSLIHLANASIQAAQPLAVQNGVQVVTDFAPDLPDLYIDARLIGQAFDGLISNAIKFSQHGGQVMVRIHDVGTAVQIDVLDQGIGIPLHEHDKIWKRFYQIDGSMTRQYGGTGLGLAIVKQAVEKHEGRVWVESTPGHGSTFSFVLPKVSPDAAGIG